MIKAQWCWQAVCGVNRDKYSKAFETVGAGVYS